MVVTTCAVDTGKLKRSDNYVLSPPCPIQTILNTKCIKIFTYMVGKNFGLVSGVYQTQCYTKLPS